MASDHMMPSAAAALVQPWAVKSAAWPDNYFSDLFFRDTDVVTRALQQSLSSPNSPAPAAAILVANVQPPSSSTSGASSEPDSPAPAPPARQSGVKLSPAAGRVAKRKSRAAKRSPTTVINTDPANFRRMVQQVTGIRMAPPSAAAAAAVLKPEPQRLGGAGGGRAVVVPQQQCLLPTLDTSAFLLGHHQQQAMAPPLPFGSADGGFSADFDAFGSFPTLESWRVM